MKVVYLGTLLLTGVHIQRHQQRVGDTMEESRNKATVEASDELECAVNAFHTAMTQPRIERCA